MSENQIELSIVIPCLNEAATLERTIHLACEAIKTSGMPGEVVVADNGSQDDSVSIGRRCHVKVIHATNTGYGFALQAGIANASGKFVIIGDADATYDFCEIIPMLELLGTQADIAIGNRFAGRIVKNAMPALHRYIGTPLLTFLVNLFFCTHISDVNCGLRAMTKDAFYKLKPISGGMEFSSELIIKAGIYGLQIQEFPCSLHTGRPHRRPHLNTWRDGWRHLRLILLFAPHIVFAIPGWAMLLSGLSITVLVLPKAFYAFGFTMDYHYLFYSIPMIVLGYQALWLEKYNRDYLRFSGYLPEECPVGNSRVSDKIPLEGWLLAGFVMMMVGMGILVGLFLKWAATAFGSLSQFRLGLSGMLFLIIGAQTLMNALMVSMMRIKINR